MAKRITVVGEFKDQISKESKKASQNLSKNFSGAAKSAKGMTTGMSVLAGAVGGVSAAITTKLLTAVGKIPSSFLKASTSVENLTVQFETILGSASAAQARIEELVNFAASTPFQLPAIAKASKVLETLTEGTLSTGKGLRLVGDAAAASGESFENLAVHVGRAFSGLMANRPIGESASRLQELGLISGKVRNRIEELQKAGRGKEAWRVLQTELKTSEGAMERLSNTADGMISTIKDLFDQIMRDVGSGGVFDSFKGGLKTVRDTMDLLVESGVFKDLGKQISDAFGAFFGGPKSPEKMAKDIEKSIRSLKKEVILLAAAFKGAWISAKTLFEGIKLGASLASTLMKRLAFEQSDIFKKVQNINLKRGQDLHKSIKKIEKDIRDTYGVSVLEARKAAKRGESINRLQSSAVNSFIANVRRLGIEMGLTAEQAERILPRRLLGKWLIGIKDQETLLGGLQKAWDNFIEGTASGVTDIQRLLFSLNRELEKASKTPIIGSTGDGGGGTKPTPPKSVVSVSDLGGDARLKATEDIIAAKQKEAEEIEEVLSLINQETNAQLKLRDIAIASISDQFDARRATLSAQVSDEIASVRDLMNQKLISKQEGENAITEIERAASEERKAISDEEAQFKMQKEVETVEAVIGGINTVASAFQSLYSMQISNIDKEARAQIEAVKKNVKGRKAQEKEIAKIEKEAEARRKQARKAELITSLVMAIANTALGVTQALANNAPPLSFVLAALVGAAGAVNIGIISSQISKLASGGIVGGQGQSDSEPALLTPGEMVLNSSQQARLFALANGGGGGAVGTGSPIQVTETFIVQGNLDEAAVEQIRVDREQSLMSLRDDLSELAFRGQIDNVVTA